MDELDKAIIENENAAVYNYQEIRKLQRQIEAAAEHRQRQARRIQELERRTEAQARAIKAQSNLIDSVKELFKAELAWRNEELEKRITGNETMVNILHEQLSATARELTASQENNVVLTRLVERMGRNIAPMEARRGYVLQYPHTIIGQREWQAAQHDAEGEPETRESTGAWGHE